MMELTARPLTEETWEDFATLVEANNGVYGGCWCFHFHRCAKDPKGTSELNRERKYALVCDGTAKAALVFHGDKAVGWCQFGRTDTLPNIKNRKEYQAGMGDLPDWRITCFFVGKGYRRKGVATLALRQALELMAAEGGGVVEAYADETEGRKAPFPFLWGGTTKMMMAEGFTRDRQLGKHTWVMRKEL